MPHMTERGLLTLPASFGAVVLRVPMRKLLPKLEKTNLRQTLDVETFWYVHCADISQYSYLSYIYINPNCLMSHLKLIIELL